MGMNSGFIGIDQRHSRNGMVGLDKMYLQCRIGEWASFDPLSQTGLLAWYDASNIASIGKDGSNNVSTWASGTATANTASELASGTKSVFSTDHISFINGITDCLTLGTRITTARTVFMVVKHATGTSSNYEFLLADTSNYDWHGTTGTHIFDAGYSASNIQSGTAYVNGTSVGSPLNLTKSTAYQILCIEPAGDVTVGQITGDRGNTTDRTWNGSYREIMVCDQIYDSAIRAQFIGYLRNKWS